MNSIRRYIFVWIVLCVKFLIVRAQIQQPGSTPSVASPTPAAGGTPAAPGATPAPSSKTDISQQAKDDAATLYKTLSADNFDPQPFIDIIPKSSCDHRTEIGIAYAQAQKRLIVEDINNEPTLSVADKVILGGAFFCYSELYAYMIRMNFDKDKQTGFRKRVLTDISVRASLDMEMRGWINEDFDTLNNKNLKYMVKKHLKNDYKHFMQELWFKHTRDEKSAVDDNQASVLAKALLAEKKKTKFKNKRKILDKCLLDYSVDQTINILKKFNDEYKKTLDVAIQENRKGDLMEAYVWLINYINDATAYEVARFDQAVSDGDDGFILLSLLILSHSDTNLSDILTAYESAIKTPFTTKAQSSLPDGVFKSIVLGFANQKGGGGGGSPAPTPAPGTPSSTPGP